MNTNPINGSPINGNIVPADKNCAVAERAGSPLSYLVCELGGICIGIEALGVQEITPLPAWTQVPGRPPLVAGVVDVRGQFVPVIDIAAAMGLPERVPQRSDMLVLLRCGGVVAGIVVHEVQDVQPLTSRRFEAPREVRTSDGTLPTAFTSGLAILDNVVVQLVSLGAVLHPEPAHVTATLSLANVSSQDATVFESRARALSLATDGGTTDEILELAVVTLQGERFGLELSVVREFASLRTITPIPRAPSHILGLINLRGETLPLVDACLPLGLPPVDIAGESGTRAHVVVIECGGVRAGLVVNAVLDVRRAPMAELRAHTARDERDPLRATWMDTDGLLGVLDAARLVSEERTE